MQLSRPYTAFELNWRDKFNYRGEFTLPRVRVNTREISFARKKKCFGTEKVREAVPHARLPKGTLKKKKKYIYISAENKEAAKKAS